MSGLPGWLLAFVDAATDPTTQERQVGVALGAVLGWHFTETGTGPATEPATEPEAPGTVSDLEGAAVGVESVGAQSGTARVAWDRPARAMSAAEVYDRAYEGVHGPAEGQRARGIAPPAPWQLVGIEAALRARQEADTYRAATDAATDAVIPREAGWDHADDDERAEDLTQAVTPAPGSKLRAEPPG
jgi:hypothetical protein